MNSRSNYLAKKANIREKRRVAAMQRWRKNGAVSTFIPAQANNSSTAMPSLEGFSMQCYSENRIEREESIFEHSTFNSNEKEIKELKMLVAQQTEEMKKWKAIAEVAQRKNRELKQKFSKLKKSI